MTMGGYYGLGMTGALAGAAQAQAQQNAYLPEPKREDPHMKTSEKIDLLAGALALAQAEMPNAAFNRVNPHFKSQYADLAAIREATLPSLTKNGLSIVQVPTITAAGFVLLSRLLHKSGQWIEADYPIQGDTPQARGSGLTYAKRYSWAALSGVASDEDDDANVAEHAVKQGVTEAVLGAETWSKAKSRPVYDQLIKDMRAIDNRSELSKWGMSQSTRIHSMHADFVRFFTEEYKEHAAKLRDNGSEEIEDEGSEEGSE